MVVFNEFKRELETNNITKKTRKYHDMINKFMRQFPLFHIQYEYSQEKITFRIVTDSNIPVETLLEIYNYGEYCHDILFDCTPIIKATPKIRLFRHIPSQNMKLTKSNLRDVLNRRRPLITKLYNKEYCD
jgi:hypothetical protein